MSKVVKWFLVCVIAFGMGMLTCYLIVPKVEVRPWVRLPQVPPDLPPMKD